MTRAAPHLPDDDAALQRAVQAANLPTLMLAVVRLTGDATLLRDDLAPRRASPQRPDGGLDAEQAVEVRARALEVLRAYRDGDGRIPASPSDEQLRDMLSYSLGMPVPAAYIPMMRQDMHLDPEPEAGRGTALPEDFEVLVIGAGQSGILASIELQKAGIAHRVIEKNRELGGTWFENSYPGCRVDLPSHFYTYSFERNPDWSEHFARRDELLRYFKSVADKYRVYDHVEFETEVRGARYDAVERRWQVTLAKEGRERRVWANALISAVGQLNRPVVPELPGLSDFAGTAFHSARFRHDVPLEGKRVGVVGSGASAMQIVPSLASKVKQLLVFQRSPQWAIDSPDYFRPVSEGERWLLRHVPYYAAFYRFRCFYTNGDGLHESLQIDPQWPHPERSLNAQNDRIRELLTRHIERELGEQYAALRERVVPDYPPFAKRMLLDNGWYQTLKRPNVDLVSEGIARATPRGLQTQSGDEHELDVVVFATGFHANRFLWPMEFINGDGVSLAGRWGDDPRAYLGISVPDFPNLFMLYGPNTNLAHGGSIIFHSECQMRYIMGCLRLLGQGGHAAMACKQAVHDAYNDRVDAAHQKMVWTHPGARNWYRNSAGRVTTNSPFTLVDYWAMTRKPDPDDFVFLA